MPTNDQTGPIYANAWRAHVRELMLKASWIGVNVKVVQVGVDPYSIVFYNDENSIEIYQHFEFSGVTESEAKTLCDKELEFVKAFIEDAKWKMEKAARILALQKSAWAKFRQEGRLALGLTNK